MNNISIIEASLKRGFFYDIILNMSNVKKTRYAKAIGVKSSFLIDGILFTTTFKNRNDFLLSNKMENSVIINFDNSKIVLSNDNQDLYVSNDESKENIKINNPLKNKKSDIIKINKVYEELFFDKSYLDNDNIHIQIAYNILDINKIITLYYYDIIYAFKTILRDKNVKDFIGNIPYKISFDENYNVGEFLKFDRKANKRYSYFPIFKSSKLNNSSVKDFNKSIKEINEHNYNVLRVLSFIRQSISHTNKKMTCKLFNIESKLNEDLIDFINECFNDGLYSKNESFTEYSNNNISILSQFYNNNDIKLIDRYYKFAILQEYKNIGINIYKVMDNVFEIIKSESLFNIEDKRYYTFKNKYNFLLKYFIYSFLLDNNHQKYIDELRKTINQDEKDKIYVKIANDFIFYSSKFDNKTNFYNRLANEISNTFKVSKKKYIKKANIFKYEFSIFSKLIYFMGLFLTLKEKNEFLSSLINKFENIGSLNDTYLTISNKEVEYKKEYEELFKNASLIADQLIKVKGLLHSKNNDKKITAIKLEDALSSLNLNGKSFIKETTYKFLRKNVLCSYRFNYLIRRSNPNDFNKLIHSRNLIISILNKFPDDSLENYYENIFYKSIDIKTNKDKCLNDLFLEMKKINFNYFEICLKKINHHPFKVSYDSLKTLFDLYYEVLYLIIKNMVKINSVFIVAFECLERDYFLLYKNSVFKNSNNQKLLNIALDFYKKKNRKKYQELNKCLDEFNQIPNINDIFSKLRNAIMHVDIIDNLVKYIDDINFSLTNDNDLPLYYDLYVYLLERTIMDFDIKDNYFKNKYFDLINKYKTYSEDFIRLILIPFGYNLARYKNLTNKELFYDQYKNKK